MPSTAFSSRKQKILEQLNVPSAEYTDLSPKGSVDEGIRTLIRDINEIAGLVTTSSCAGRISVYLDGPSSAAQTPENAGDEPNSTRVTSGGKGGGQWLFVSHDPLDIAKNDEHTSSESQLLSRFGLRLSSNSISDDTEPKQFIHFKFEPVVCPVV
jgi:tRNA wybutosine-synthesizing protein 3